MILPCHECERRTVHPNCHANCHAYLAYSLERQRIRQKRWEDGEADRIKRTECQKSLQQK